MNPIDAAVAEYYWAPEQSPAERHAIILEVVDDLEREDIAEMPWYFRWVGRYWVWDFKRRNRQLFEGSPHDQED